MNMLVALMDQGAVVGEWIAEKGYVWGLPNSGDSKNAPTSATDSPLGKSP